MRTTGTYIYMFIPPLSFFLSRLVPPDDFVFRLELPFPIVQNVQLLFVQTDKSYSPRPRFSTTSMPTLSVILPQVRVRSFRPAKLRRSDIVDDILQHKYILFSCWLPVYRINSSRVTITSGMIAKDSISSWRESPGETRDCSPPFPCPLPWLWALPISRQKKQMRGRFLLFLWVRLWRFFLFSR